MCSAPPYGHRKGWVPRTPQVMCCVVIVISQLFLTVYWFIREVSKFTCQLIFSSLSVKCKPISIKIDWHVLKETLNKICASIIKIGKFEMAD